MNSKKNRKGVVTRKEDNKLYIRYYGSSINDGGGTAGKVGETLFFDDDTDINIGDFVSTDAGWWWPVGSKETTAIDGKLFAKGSPSATRLTASLIYPSES